MVPVSGPHEHSAVPEILKNSIWILREFYRGKTSGDILVEGIREVSAVRSLRLVKRETEGRT